jgi:predicted Zn-dependent peptidase
MKKILAVLLLISQFAPCDPQESTEENCFREFTLVNGVHVSFYEDFRMPLVTVGIIFHAGNVDAPDKSGVAQAVAENIINRRTHRRLVELGISYNVNASHECTEIVAEMSPRALLAFLRIMCEVMRSPIRVENLDVYKKQVAINHRLEVYCKEKAVNDNICAAIDPRMVFNEHAFSAITEDDVVAFFDKYCRRANISVIVIGAVGYKNLIKNLQTSVSRLPKITKRRPVSVGKITSVEMRLESKYSSNCLMFAYALPQQEDIAMGDVFSSVSQYEMFRFFRKFHDLISFFSISDALCGGYVVKFLTIFPKGDISLVDLNRMYDVFVNRISCVPLTDETLSEIALREKFRTKSRLTDFADIYDSIKHNSIAGGDINSLQTLPERIKKTDPEQLRLFIEKVFRQYSAAKLLTQYRLDK